MSPRSRPCATGPATPTTSTTRSGSTTSASSRSTAPSSTGRSEGKVEIELMPMLTPFGGLDQLRRRAGRATQQLDTSGEALLFPARTRIRAAAYWFNEIAHTPITAVARCSRPASRTSRSMAPRSIFRPTSCHRPTMPPASPRSLSFAPKSVSYSLFQDLPSIHGGEPQPAAHRARADGRSSCSPRARTTPPRPSTSAIRTCTIETANTAEIGLKRTLGDVPLRRQGLLHALQQLHLPAADRINSATTRSRPAAPAEPSFIQTVYLPARCDLPRRGSSPGSGTCCRSDVRHLRSRRPIRHRPRDLHGRQQRAAHAAAARRRRRLLAQRQLVRPHRPSARVGAEQLGAVRDADRRLQSGEGGDHASANSGSIRRGDRSRSRPVSSATTCSTSRCATPPSSTRTKSCCLDAAFKFFLNAKFDADRPSGPPGYFKANASKATTRRWSTRRRS